MPVGAASKPREEEESEEEGCIRHPAKLTSTTVEIDMPALSFVNVEESSAAPPPPMEEAPPPPPPMEENAAEEIEKRI